MSKVIQATDKEWSCVSCGGKEIDVALWVRPNHENEILDIVASSLYQASQMGQTFCHDCDDHTELREPKCLSLNRL